MHEMKKGIGEAFWEMHNEKFLFRVTICNCQSHHYAYLKLGDQRLCLNWETINSIKTKTALEFGQNILNLGPGEPAKFLFVHIYVYLERAKVLPNDQMQMH